MKVHSLKTDKSLFGQSFAGSKPWKIRFDDRGFEIGDLLLLEETVHSGIEMKEGAPLQYTGRELSRLVTFIFKGEAYGVKTGYVIMSVSKV